MTREMGPPDEVTVFQSAEHEAAHDELMDLLLTIDPDLWDTDERVIAARRKLAEFEAQDNGQSAADVAGK